MSSFWGRFVTSEVTNSKLPSEDKKRKSEAAEKASFFTTKKLLFYDSEVNLSDLIGYVWRHQLIQKQNKQTMR